MAKKRKENKVNTRNNLDRWRCIHFLRWPTSVTAKLPFSRQNFLSLGKTFFQHGKTIFLTTDLSFSSRQNYLSHGKTFFLTAKLSFLTAKLSFLTATFSFYNQKSSLHKSKGKGDKYGC